MWWTSYNNYSLFDYTQIQNIFFQHPRVWWLANHLMGTKFLVLMSSANWYSDYFCNSKLLISKSLKINSWEDNNIIILLQTIIKLNTMSRTSQFFLKHWPFQSTQTKPSLHICLTFPTTPIRDICWGDVSSHLPRFGLNSIVTGQRAFKHSRSFSVQINSSSRLSSEEMWQLN